MRCCMSESEIKDWLMGWYLLHGEWEFESSAVGNDIWHLLKGKQLIEWKGPSDSSLSMYLTPKALELIKS